MPPDRPRTVIHDGDIVKIDGKSVRMEFMVRDSFWMESRAIVLLDPDAFLDNPVYGAQRRRARKPVQNLRAYSPAGELLWQAQQPELEDHYYRIESRDQLVALSFSAYRCDIDPATGRIASKTRLK